MNEARNLFAHGKICYVEIPAIDIAVSAKFYHDIFGWKIDHRRDGSVSFDDVFGYVSGMFTFARKPATDVGMVFSIMVNNAAATLDLIVKNGGRIVEPLESFAPVKAALFSDPAGNIWSVYQHGN